MNKIIIVYILLLILNGTNNVRSQNAFSDAILISQNREEYLKKINMILKPGFEGQYSERQGEELKNLQRFLINPWDQDIKNLNLKIVLEVSKIVLKFGQLPDYYKSQSDAIDGVIANFKNVLDEKELKLQGLLITDSAFAEKKINLENEISKLKKEVEENEEKSKKFLEDAKQATELIKDQTSFDEFKISLANKTDVISTLGKDNEEAISQTVSNSHFSLSQAAIIEAIGNAIVEQVKEGLVNSLFEGVLDKEIEYKGENTKLKNELRVLFPETIKILEKLKEHNTDNFFTNLNITLKNAFSDDLKNMLNNITNTDNYKNSKIFNEFVFANNSMSEYNEVFKYLKLSVVLITNIKNGFHPVELIPNFKEFLVKNKLFKEYSNYISMIDVLQNNIRDITNDAKNIWINISNMDELNSKSSEIKIKYSSGELFLALLYQYGKKDGISKFDYIKHKFIDENGILNVNRFDSLKSDLSSFVILLRGIEKNVNELSSGKEKSFNDYEQYLNNFINILKVSDGLLSKYFFNEKEQGKISNYVNDIEKYIIYSTDIYKSVTNGSYSKILPVIMDIFEKELKLADKESDFKKEIIRYTNLYVDVSTANSQDELNSAINKAVHNSGGYLRKIEETFTISVDSYPGIFSGFENINNTKYLFTNGFTVPIGIDLGFSLGDHPGINFDWFQLYFHRIGIFIQAFDIAAAVSYRYNSQGTTNLPADVTVSQVFSPGVFFTLNFFKTFPMTLNLGFYATPALRTITESGLTLNNSKSIRFGINVSYDVPLWYLY